jgi:serine/threonine protein kinase
MPGRDPFIVAAKELKKYESSKSLYKRELNFLTSLQHDSICKCLGGWFTTDVEKNIKPTIILEYLPHKFTDAVRDAKLKGPDGDIFLTMHDVNRICIRLAEVLTWLGSSSNTLGVPVYHKDVKPDNIMLSAELQPKLIDLGLSQKQRNSQMTKELGSDDVSGTHNFIV